MRTLHCIRAPRPGRRCVLHRNVRPLRRGRVIRYNERRERARSHTLRGAIWTDGKRLIVTDESHLKALDLASEGRRPRLWGNWGERRSRASGVRGERAAHARQQSVQAGTRIRAARQPRRDDNRRVASEGAQLSI